MARTLEVAPEPGIHRVVWDLEDGDENDVAPGEYTVTLESGEVRQNRPLVVRPPVVVPRR